MNNHIRAILISITATMFLALVIIQTESNAYSIQKTIPKDAFSSFHGSKLPELNYYGNYDLLRSEGKTVVIYPIFTQSAYQWGGFHDFVSGHCDTCLEVEIQNFYEKGYSSSGNAFRILEFLGYEIIDDIDLDKNPGILKKYDKVILLHNEYVTHAEFTAISNHPNVVYLYPNALRAEVYPDYSKNTISLIKGNGYPENENLNGFQWKYDNSEYFSDWECQNWEFYPVQNGHMLNCYPENFLPLYGTEMLFALKNL